MSAVQLFTDNFTRADGAPGNGWSSAHPEVWAIAGNKLVATADGTANPQTIGYVLLRPSSEDRLDQQIVAEWTQATGDRHWAMARYNRTTGDRYLSYADSGFVVLQKSLVAGGAVMGTPAAVTLIVGHRYRLTLTVSGVSPATITSVLFDVTAGTTTGTTTATDSSATLQGVGGYGLAYDAGTLGATTSFLLATTSDLDGATLYTLTPASATVAPGVAQTFTLAPNGSFIGTLTPHVTGSAVVSPTTRVYAGQNTPATFTVTDAVAEVVTVSATNSASLTNPGNATLTVFKKRKRGGAMAMIRRAKMAASFQLPPRS